jgi:cysteine desulfurase
VDPERFAEAAGPRTVLACLMHVNNELGTIQPVAEAFAAVKRQAPRCLTLVDAVQSFTRLPVDPEAWQADLLTVSGHKVGGPRGIGALVARTRRPEALYGGGEQEWGARPGTENVPGAAGFAAAVRRRLGRQAEFHRHAEALRETFGRGLAARVPRARVNGDPARTVPWIVSVSVGRLPSEALLRSLEELGVVVSAGAACHARSQKQSHVLAAIGLPSTTGTARFSFGEETLRAAIDEAVDALALTVQRYAL